jgi:hypothetical protein
MYHYFLKEGLTMKKNAVLFISILTVIAAVYGQESTDEIIVSGNTLPRKFDWLLSNAEDGKTYVIIFDRDETLQHGQNLDYDGRKITIIFRGRGAMRKINLSNSASESILLVRSGVTLILENLITIHGNAGDSLVRVGNGGTLIINNNTVISGNTIGRGVNVDGGTFIMEGGTISGNTAGYEGPNILVGGGVFVAEDGTFTMNNGTISGNASVHGSGVHIEGGTFTMNGGTISGNTASLGAGVTAWGTFTMTGGSISGNSGEMGGVTVSGEDGIFTMTGGSISGNNIGGGVYVGSSGTLNINSPATKASVSGNSGYSSDSSQVYLIDNTSIFRVNGLRERSY